MRVKETFFTISVSDMGRATAFYAAALDAEVVFVSATWSSLRIAGVRLGLFFDPDHAGGKVGLHFVLDDLSAANAEFKRAGGRVVSKAVQVAPGVVIAEAADTEGNVFTVRQA